MIISLLICCIAISFGWYLDRHGKLTFSIRGVLVVTMLVAAFLSGRGSRDGDIQQLELERDKAQLEAEARLESHYSAVERNNELARELERLKNE